MSKSIFRSCWRILIKTMSMNLESRSGSASVSNRKNLQTNLRTAGTALANWWRAVTLEGRCVGLLWLIGLLLLHVPLAAVWALIGGLMTLVPNFGGVIALCGPVFAVLVTGKDMYRLGLVLGLYALIVVIDQLLLQPMLMK